MLCKYGEENATKKIQTRCGMPALRFLGSGGTTVESDAIVVPRSLTVPNAPGLAAALSMSKNPAIDLSLNSMLLFIENEAGGLEPKPGSKMPFGVCDIELFSSRLWSLTLRLFMWRLMFGQSIGDDVDEVLRLRCPEESEDESWAELSGDKEETVECG